jgi:hypothetical protein
MHWRVMHRLLELTVTSRYMLFLVLHMLKLFTSRLSLGNRSSLY